MERNVELAGEANDLEGGEGVRLTATQLKILGAIAASRGRPISHKEIAENVGCCGRTVVRAIARFRDAGLIEVRQTQRADGGQDANAYVLPECSDRENRAG